MSGTEGIDLRADGTVGWAWPGVSITMRRPTLGEFRKLREQLHNLQDAQSEARRKVTDLSTEITAALTERQPLEDLAAKRDVIRAQTAEIENADLAWLRSAFDLVADAPLPAEDDLPAWFASSGPIINDLVMHWRSRPLAPGAI